MSVKIPPSVSAQRPPFDFGSPEDLKAVTLLVRDMSSRFEAENRSFADKIHIGGSSSRWFDEHPITKTAVGLLLGGTGLALATVMSPVAWLYEKVTGKSQGIVHIRGSEGQMILGRGD